MTEHAWLSCSNLRLMLQWLGSLGPARERKLRLFACATVRAIWHLLADDRSKRAVEVAERFADGNATLQELNQSCADARKAAGDISPKANDGWMALRAANAATLIADAEAFFAASLGHSHAARATGLEGVIQKKWPAPKTRAEMEEQMSRLTKPQCDLLRDLFGPLLFRPIPFAPTWQTSAVLSLAQDIYERRSFERLPELADLLTAEGCDSTELLSHLRSPGPRYLGTWSLDVVLGKEAS